VSVFHEAIPKIKLTFFKDAVYMYFLIVFLVCY